MTRAAARAALALGLLTGPALADEGFVEANIIGIFYHELGHAVIDIEAVPIFGQEEDAADVFSIFMIDALFEEEAAVELAFSASFGFLGEVEMRGYNASEIPFWGQHGPDEQRFYNTVCLFYGADPEARADFAADLDLPKDRAETCAEEFDQANASWGALLDEMLARGGGDTLRFEGDDSLTGQILAEEVAYLNAELSLAQPLLVLVESCGEANAFYDPGDRAIVMCLEFEDHLFEMAEILEP
jgi:hypothetical protein